VNRARTVYDLRGVRGYDALRTRSTSVERQVGHVTCEALLCWAIDSVLLKCA
jgi:hypothetical protein